MQISLRRFVSLVALAISLSSLMPEAFARHGGGGGHRGTVATAGTTLAARVQTAVPKLKAAIMDAVHLIPEVVPAVDIADANLQFCRG